MRTVLVVDDDLSILELIMGYLRAEGYSVISATDAKEALNKAISQKPDVVVTDVVMPGMSGFELCRSIKKNEETRSLPVVICTSKNQELDRLWGMKQGADVFITKPFGREDLLKAVRSVVA
ncbi:Alkaline phosphatase synthesis transcriptional regulatory protein PhoP [Acaryochloris thomasi RCC1774]|uniref:Alkaline phosphatase synthesis transcriptional regulatory protein PhoP n=1 Tax=Acaryochloris thomasi RCC1774 TaxID=1764569 RepID=A0A2W1JE39_9CYAN|nr:response regulator [Acaryochloris thomasi]PZD71986.1 Alkaline phosphatase synthesis transcriptional regulatory protein PhoP [Acaryochloris thomasi RCC1774]